MFAQTQLSKFRLQFSHATLNRLAGLNEIFAILSDNWIINWYAHLSRWTFAFSSISEWWRTKIDIISNFIGTRSSVIVGLVLLIVIRLKEFCESVVLLTKLKEILGIGTSMMKQS